MFLVVQLWVKLIRFEKLSFILRGLYKFEINWNFLRLSYEYQIQHVSDNFLCITLKIRLWECYAHWTVVLNAMLITNQFINYFVKVYESVIGQPGS